MAPITTETLLAIARQTWRRNINPKGPAVYPSHSYGGIYLRDTFWTLAALANRRLSRAQRDQFARAQRSSGQIPSFFEHFRGRAHYDDDESTVLYVIWMYLDYQHFGALPDLPRLQKALHYLTHFDQGGYYISSGQGPHSWLDTLRINPPDTLGYTQGRFAVALRCAEVMQARIRPAQVKAAAHAYAALYRPSVGYIPLLRHSQDSDVSVLTGEFVSLWLFGLPMLSDHTVLSTLHHFTSTAVGYKVIAQLGGDYLAAHRFSVPLSPGDYQNGATWLLYDYMALATGYLHGWVGAQALMTRRLALEIRDGFIFSEYRCTNNALLCMHKGDPARAYTAWNTFLLVINQVVDCRSGRGRW